MSLRRISPIHPRSGLLFAVSQPYSRWGGGIKELKGYPTIDLKVTLVMCLLEVSEFGVKALRRVGSAAGSQPGIPTLHAPE